jgi:hypothetical protein
VVQPLHKALVGQPLLSSDSAFMLRKMKPNWSENMYCPFSLFASPPLLPYGPCPSILHNVVIVEHLQSPYSAHSKSSHSSFPILNHISPNHCDLHLLEILIHGPRTLIQTLEFHIQISIIVVRHKAHSNQHFHLLPRRYRPLSTPSPTNHILIPPNQCIICELHDYQFYLLRLE